MALPSRGEQNLVRLVNEQELASFTSQMDNSYLQSLIRSLPSLVTRYCRDQISASRHTIRVVMKRNGDLVEVADHDITPSCSIISHAIKLIQGAWADGDFTAVLKSMPRLALLIMIALR